MTTWRERGSHGRSNRRTALAGETLKRVACASGTRGQSLRRTGNTTKDGKSIPSVPLPTSQNRELSDFVAERDLTHRVTAIPAGGAALGPKAFLSHAGHRSLVRMLISEVSVRCTGHLLAMSSNRERYSALKDPSNRTSRSILSSMPSRASHSEQSAAYIFECRSQTVILSNGQFFFRAYVPTVIEVQEPRAASKKS